MTPQISNLQADQFNDFANFLSFKKTWVLNKYALLPHRIVALFTGNQSCKTSTTAYLYVQRILGIHSVAEKNVVFRRCQSRYCPDGHRYHADKVPEDKICLKCGEEINQHSGHNYHMATILKDNKCLECGEDVIVHKRGNRIFRFASQVLPTPTGNKNKSEETDDVKNTQYPEFKKWLPRFLIKKDITFRNTVMTIYDIFGGQDIYVEFMGYGQPSKGAGVQRISCWLDESSPKEFYDEQLPRLLAENGDIILTLTPSDFIGWEYDEIFEKAKVYYRTKAICDFLSTKDEKIKQIEETNSPTDIAVIQAATDDNPTLSIATIEEMFSNIDDPDMYAIRRYGIFKQVSGRIFKDFDYKVHFIKRDKYFKDGIPHDWSHFRGCDYHPETDWHYGIISLSSRNEAFVWKELIMSPDRYITREMAREFALAGKDYKFKLNLIDPLAEATKKDCVTVLEDFNRAFYELKKEGIGVGGYWQSWDTKGEKGRDAIRERLKNAKKVARPFNNVIVTNRGKQYLPTIWWVDNCPVSAKYAKQWRWKQRTSNKATVMQGDVNEPEQKFSHMNMVWEAIHKHPAFKPPRLIPYITEKKQKQYFKSVTGRR